MAYEKARAVYFRPCYIVQRCYDSRINQREMVIPV
jgi:hypothetical protein